MFCRNCGKELIGTPEICPNCRIGPLAGSGFCPNCGAPTSPLLISDICTKCGARVGKAVAGKISPKSRMATSVLAFFLGRLGGHRFYLRKNRTAIAMLLLDIFGWAFLKIDTSDFAEPLSRIGLTFVTGVGIWACVDLISAVSGQMKDKEGRFISNW